VTVPPRGAIQHEETLPLSSLARRVASRRALAPLAAAAIAASAVLGAPALALAHVQEHAGPYLLEIGWLREPAYAGQPNAVQVTIHDAKDQPVTDLSADDLKVVVSTGTATSAELSFEPGFDPEEMEGALGEYDAAILPTASGDYTFHLTGTVHGNKVDVSVSSSGETFDPIVGSDDIEFPDKVPTLNEVATRLDRIDQRIAAIPAGSSGADVQAAQQAAADARSAADRALLVGGGVGALGLVIAIAALAFALRSRRTPA
jgi:hypothetical protein